jgi:aminoglycoside phosphotransferase (APT) family kinase protein
MGTQDVRADDPEDRKKFLTALGRLHGWGIRWLKERNVYTDCLLRYDGTSLPHAGMFLPVRQWTDRLCQAVDTPALGIKTWMVSFPSQLIAHLTRQPITLLHGDTNFSNGIIVDHDLALIDFERAFIGPPSLDLGQAIERVETDEELNAYHSSFQDTSGEVIPFSTLTEWVDLGKGYNSLHWVSYYVERTLAGNPPDSEWREKYHEPSAGQDRADPRPMAASLRMAADNAVMRADGS